MLHTSCMTHVYTRFAHHVDIRHQGHSTVCSRARKMYTLASRNLHLAEWGNNGCGSSQSSSCSCYPHLQLICWNDISWCTTYFFNYTECNWLLARFTQLPTQLSTQLPIRDASDSRRGAHAQEMSGGLWSGQLMRGRAFIVLLQS